MSKTGWRFNFIGLSFILLFFTGCEKDIILGPDSSFYPDNTLTLVSEEGQVIIEL